MEFIKVSVKDHIATVTLSRGKSNALNHAMIAELDDMFNNIKNDDAIAGVILTGNAPFFSAGLDLIELYDYNEEQVKNFWIVFLQFATNLVSFKKPLVAAISGHALAGGCVMALAADYRIMADGPFIIGLNEVPVGIIVPNNIFNLYAFWLGCAQAARSLLQGTLYNPQEALAIGLVDELVNGDSLLTIAERKMKKFVELESNTWQQTKLAIRKDLIKSFEETQSAFLDRMMAQWWAPATRALLKTIIDNLKRK
ncbi:3,2-trans-enoyl-CoA isomerase [Pedobacter sp. UYP30]|uniref:enoyl-CoA hydratase/isomerase family protein n=1 Tax=Pedobacter sp. UYP30 TaxID=1756400 RepID=UPI0033979643